MKSNPLEFEKLSAIIGYNLYIGSSDATHVGILSWGSWTLISHLVYKLNILVCTKIAIVSHCREVFGMVCGHPAT